MTRRSTQHGAVLYVALIMLILLTLIGIVGLKVASLQERMAANYRATNLAFQRAETEARTQEEAIRAALAAGTTYSADLEHCDTTFDPRTWADARTSTDAPIITRRIDKCFAGSSLREGERLNEDTSNTYEITVVGTDEASASAATAVVNTVFIP